jgi:hypothetical protein
MRRAALKRAWTDIKIYSNQRIACDAGKGSEQGKRANQRGNFAHGFGGTAIRRTECHTGNPATAAAMPENDARTPAGTLFLQQAQGFVGRA